MRKLFFVVSICFLAVNLNGQQDWKDQKLFLMRGNGMSVAFILPDAWTLDTDIARHIDVDGFFYLEEYDTRTSPGIIMLMLTQGDNKHTFKDFVTESMALFFDFYKDFSGEKVSLDIKPKHGYTIELYKFYDTKGHLQYSAYIDTGKNYFANISITINNKDETEKLLDDFIFCLENTGFN